ncbi:N-chimaerin-like isoform X3 [Penaeus japonicus]|uniref:N-chimaerin-like isoform X3 n=1 Tax=Penaeus japonicus TaxID=27405 RepID=UPI001C71026B|nr:N-chimaerin-like isoform X3 [Penaeus japonicus]
MHQGRLAEGGRGLEQHRRVSSVWKSYLYQLQQEAPKPAAVLCTDRPPDSPPYYGLEYHGTIGRHHCETLLTENGTYIVRHSERAEGFYTLSMRFNDVIKHFRLFYDGKHYVGEKRFDTVHDLVADGLVTLYMESQAGEYLKKMSATSYLNSPHYTLTKSLRRHIRTNRYTGVDTENRQPICPKDTTTLSKPEDQDKDSNNTQDITTQRPHRFNVHTFTGLHWCGLCGHFLWGFVSQGVKCQDCNFKAHKQCSCKVPNDCCPDLKDLQTNLPLIHLLSSSTSDYLFLQLQCTTSSGIFGADLTTSLRGSTDRVPSVVTECVSEVEARGLTMEGIYRVPGSQDQIEALRLAFERDGNRVNLNEKAVSDINVVAGVLKLYLRLLPIPLITSQCFLRLQAVCKLSTREAKVSGIREALLTLPVAHLSTLKVIIMHLARVCDHSAVNKMTATSLSTVFAPTLVQSAAPGENIQPADLLAMANSAQEPRVVEVLLVYHRDIFL